LNKNIKRAWIKRSSFIHTLIFSLIDDIEMHFVLNLLDLISNS
jgi:hypothetical protein